MFALQSAYVNRAVARFFGEARQVLRELKTRVSRTSGGGGGGGGECLFGS